MAGQLVGAIRELQQRRVALRQELQEVEAELKQARAMLSGQRLREPGIRLVKGQRTRPIRESSAVGTALKVLKQNGAPLHIDELIKLMNEFYGFPVRKTTLVSGLSRYVKAGDTFTRPEESVYGLISFERERLTGG